MVYMMSLNYGPPTGPTGPRLSALSAGGDRGAVLVGMLHGLYRIEGRERVNWRQIAGISAGAIVGGLVSQTLPETFDSKMEHAKDLFELGGFHVVQDICIWARYLGLGLTPGNPGLQAICSWARYLGLGLTPGNPEFQAICSWARYLGLGLTTGNLEFQTYCS